jgi:hypothetical protein
MIGLYIYGYIALFYFGFLAYAAVQDHGGFGKIPLVGKLFLWWIFFIFLLMDVIFNVTAGTLIFIQLPSTKTLTLSKRMSALISSGEGWRKSLASKIVNTFLLPYTSRY